MTIETEVNHDLNSPERRIHDEELLEVLTRYIGGEYVALSIVSTDREVGFSEYDIRTSRYGEARPVIASDEIGLALTLEDAWQLAISIEAHWGRQGLPFSESARTVKE